MPKLDPDRLFDAEPKARGIARSLYAGVKDLPLVSPHGHTDPRWYAENEKFPDPAQLLIVPDHYVFACSIRRASGSRTLASRRRRIQGRDRWADDLATVRRELFPVPRHPDADVARPHIRDAVRARRAADGKNADRFYDTISEKLQQDAFRPRALFERFNLEVISTTDSAIDDCGGTR